MADTNLVLASRQDIEAIANALREREGTLDNYTWASLVEKAIQAINAKGEDASLLPLDSIPKYVRQEAVRVANEAQKRIDKYGSNSIVFIALSDTHLTADTSDQENGYTDDNYIQPIHALMAAKIIAYALDIDFIVHMGDIAGGRPTTTARSADDIDEIKRQANIVLARMKETFKNYPIFCAIGNHDSGEYYDQSQGDTGDYMMDGEFLYNNFTKLCVPEDGAISGADTGGYCYKDIINKELRVFLLNTSERYIKKKGWNNNSNNYKWMSQNQLTWFKNNATTLPEGYNFIVLSHFPADYADDYNFSNTLKEIIEANQEKTFIAQFHGHLHNYLQDKLYQDTNTQHNAYKICIPSTESRVNQYAEYYDGKCADPRPTDITKGTVGVAANETSFVVNIINSDRDIIESIHYGAGYDRILGIGNTAYYTISSTLTNVVLEPEISSIAEGETYQATLKFFKDDYKYKSVQIEYDGNYIYDETTGLITIENVQGNIKIIASGVNYKNLIPYATQEKSTEIYGTNGYAYEGAIKIDGNYHTSTKMYNTGYIPFEAQQQIYLKNITFNSTTSSGYQRISFYDDNYTFLGSLNSAVAKAWYFKERYPEDTTKNLIMFQIRDDGTLQGPEATNINVNINNICYFRLTASKIDDSSIITVGENPYEDDPDDPFNNWTINLSLTNVTSTNSATTITKGKSYSTTLTVADGYELGDVTIRMGGIDISTNPGIITKEGNTKAMISIDAVTGDLDIIAINKVNIEVTSGNLIPQAINGASGQIYGTNGYKTGVKNIGSNGQLEGGSSTMASTGYMPIKETLTTNDIFYFKNFTFGGASPTNLSLGNYRIVFYNASFQPIENSLFNATTSSYPNWLQAGYVLENNNLIQFKLNGTKFTLAEAKYFAICSEDIGPNSIITINEPIE